MKIRIRKYKATTHSWRAVRGTVSVNINGSLDFKNILKIIRVKGTTLLGSQNRREIIDAVL